MLYNDQRLANCDPDLITLVKTVAQSVDTFVVQGARSVADEQADIDAGRSSLKDPLDSKHVIDPPIRAVALAVDMVPFDHAPSPAEWQNTALFVRFGEYVKTQAASLGLGIVWGGDWVHLKDYDHFELVHAHGETT